MRDKKKLREIDVRASSLVLPPNPEPLRTAISLAREVLRANNKDHNMEINIEFCEWEQHFIVSMEYKIPGDKDYPTLSWKRSVTSCMLSSKLVTEALEVAEELKQDTWRFYKPLRWYSATITEAQ